MLRPILWSLTVFFAFLPPVLADSSVTIDQMPKDAQPRKPLAKDLALPEGVQDTAEQPDHQAQILNDPLISDFGRANALVGANGNPNTPAASGNSITVHQDNGASPLPNSGNKVVIHQNGKHNTSKVHQKGHDNDLYLEQAGDHNTSEEEQTGDHNHKVKVQNGVKTETGSDSEEK